MKRSYHKMALPHTGNHRVTREKRCEIAHKRMSEEALNRLKITY